MKRIQSSESGSAAIEYIIVTVFGLLLSLATIAFVAKLAKQKISKLEDQLGLEFDFEAFNLFE